MNFKPYLIIAFILTFILLSWLSYRFFSASATQNTHYHAGFIIIRDGQPVDFSADQYMVPNECSLETNLTPQEIQLNKAHLHNHNGKVAHIHRENVTWSDLFTNLNYTFTTSASAYLNSQPFQDYLTRPILPDTSLVVIDGKPPTSLENALTQAVTLDQIRQAESQLEPCGT